jgi:hypothetical protein
MFLIVLYEELSSTVIHVAYQSWSERCTSEYQASIHIIIFTEMSLKPNGHSAGKSRRFYGKFVNVLSIARLWSMS